tara:strand:- start:568 stop:729 length:162 start_codon:yes stop_codon:yes gene_type:complete
MKCFITLTCAILISCGGGGGSSAPNPNAIPNPNEGLSLLPGSVNSFQPLDIDD